MSYISHNALLFHLILALITCVAIGITGLYASLLALQDRALRKPSNTHWLRFLPPLQRSEQHLFILVVLSFCLLSILLASSLYFFHKVMWLIPGLLQKTLVALMAWLMFALVLWGRWQFGWRGRIVTYFIASAVLLLLLAYIISQLALEA